MKQSPSAGVHTFCDRQKPLPDGAAQYYVAGKGPALGGTGALHCLKKQSSTHHTQTLCSEDLCHGMFHGTAGYFTGVVN